MKLAPHPHTFGNTDFGSLIKRRDSGLLPGEPRDPLASEEQQAEDPEVPLPAFPSWLVGVCIAIFLVLGTLVWAVVRHTLKT